MVIIAEKEPNMPDSPLPIEPLQEIHELNRLFLRSLQARKVDALRSAGFPAGAIDALRQASPEHLDAIAEFPRTLFEFMLESPQTGTAAPYAGPLDSSFTSRILELTIAHCAWTASRESPYRARLFFGLGTEIIQVLRSTPLSKLPWLATTRARVMCAFRDGEELWRELLLETRPEARRQLVLVALQPALQSAALSNAPA